PPNLAILAHASERRKQRGSLSLMEAISISLGARFFDRRAGSFQPHSEVRPGEDSGGVGNEVPLQPPTYGGQAAGGQSRTSVASRWEVGLHAAMAGNQ